MPRHPPGMGNIPNIFSTPQPQPGAPQNQQSRGGEYGGLGGGQQVTSPGGNGGPPQAPPGFFGSGGGVGGQGQGLPPGFMGMRAPGEAMPAGVGGVGRRFEGYGNGLGQGR